MFNMHTKSGEREGETVRYCLQLLHGNNIRRLDVVFVFLNLLLELVKGNLLVLDDQVDLELLNAESDGDQLGGTPDKTILLDGKNISLELVHVRLVV